MSPEAREHSFDELTRGLASGSISRGRALRLMGAALVGGTLASLGIGEAAADPPGCKRAGKRCREDEQCGSGTCTEGHCAAACPSGQVMCGGRCVSNTCRDPGQTFNTTTCQCEPTGTTEVICFCNDGSEISACRTGDCSEEFRNAVCGPLCESHGGIGPPPACFANDPACPPA